MAAVGNVGYLAQLAMGRRLNSVLLCTPESLAPQNHWTKDSNGIHPNGKGSKWKILQQRCLTLTQTAKKVSVRIQINGEWVPGTVT